MRNLLDLLPIVIFFVVYKLTNIFTATAVLIIATIVQMVIIYLMEKKLQLMHKLTLAFVLIFGTLTLGFHNDSFIKWKPTVLYILIALALAIGLWVLKRNFLTMFLGQQIELPEKVWYRLAISWVCYCIFMAAINAYVVVNYSTNAWMDFKLWGYVFPIVFFCGQGVYLAMHLRDQKGSKND